MASQVHNKKMDMQLILFSFEKALKSEVVKGRKVLPGMPIHLQHLTQSVQLCATLNMLFKLDYKTT